MHTVSTNIWKCIGKVKFGPNGFSSIGFHMVMLTFVDKHLPWRATNTATAMKVASRDCTYYLAGCTVHGEDTKNLFARYTPNHMNVNWIEDICPECFAKWLWASNFCQKDFHMVMLTVLEEMLAVHLFKNSDYFINGQQGSKRIPRWMYSRWRREKVYLFGASLAIWMSSGDKNFGWKVLPKNPGRNFYIEKTSL